MRVIDLSTLSLIGGSEIAESKIDLWWSDGTAQGFSDNLGNTFLEDGYGTVNTSFNPSNYSGVNIFTLSSTWLQNQQYAIEVTLYAGSGGGTVQAELWDITTNTAVSNSTVSTTSTTAVVIRSGKFSLVPSHKYGVTLGSVGSVSSNYPIDASLIVFPQ